MLGMTKCEFGMTQMVVISEFVFTEHATRDPMVLKILVIQRRMQ